jgi:hypothetical protein
MEKILFVTDAVKQDTSCLDFACFLCNLTHSKLIGIFLENVEMETRSKSTLQKAAVNSAIPGTTIKELKENYCEDNIRRFKNTCELNGVTCKVHRDRGVPLEEVITESRYADLIVIDPTTSFAYERDIIPTKFVKDTFVSAECPVIIAPQNFEGIDEIVFTYDGSRSSMFAIKQFTYLFPELHNRKVSILNVILPGEKLNSNQYKLKEWLQTHYKHIDVLVLEDEHVRMRLLEYLLTKEKAFIVMGAFGNRSILSSIFVPNHAILVVKLVVQPVFITHY